MRLRWRGVIAALAAAVPLGGCAAGARRFTTGDRASIEQAFTAQAAAWNRGDLDAFMAGYLRSADLIFTSGGEVKRGFDQTLARYHARYGTDRASMGALAFELVDLRSLGADGAVVLGRYRVTGGAHPSSGLFTVVFERRPEGWRIVHDHTSPAAAESAPAPQPAAPPAR